MRAAQLAKVGRAEAVRAVLEMLQEDMQLVCVTAVEDRLQANVRATLEMLRDANVRTWAGTSNTRVPHVLDVSRSLCRAPGGC